MPQAKSEIKASFEALQAGTSRLRNTTASQRVARMTALWAAMVDRKEDLFKAAHQERGTHDLDMAAELVMIKSELDFFAKNLAKWMRPEKIKNSLATMGKRCEIRRQSKGVVLNMAAYNAPTAESFVPMFAAIGAGNSVAIKPSELAPYSAQIIQEIVNDVFPRDEAEVFQGGIDVAQALLALPFDHIYYTGGTAVGKIVMKAAADNLASVTLEMGGKNPVIIDASAKLENAATKLAWGRVMNAGQVCIAPDYAIVHESVKEAFQNLMTEKIGALYNSDQTGFGKSPYVPRIINERHTKRVKSLIDDAVKKGASVICGGGVNITDNYVEPTLLTDVTEDMQIMREEVFGPVMCVVGYEDPQDCLLYTSPSPRDRTRSRMPSSA